jgi:hypothetical protein
MGSWCVPHNDPFGSPRRAPASPDCERRVPRAASLVLASNEFPDVVRSFGRSIVDGERRRSEYVCNTMVVL